MNVLLCLLSDQVVPNLLSVHHFRPDRLVLVETRDMERKQIAANLLGALRAGNLDYNDRTATVPLGEEDNLEAVRHCLADAYGRFPTAAWIANLTGGTKPMSIGAYEFFKAIGARVIYINLSRPTQFLGLDGRPTESTAYSLSTAEFLAAYGFASRKSERSLDEAESRAAAMWPTARLIAECAADQNLVLNVDRDAWRALREKKFTLRDGHCDHLPEAVKTALANQFGLRQAGKALHGELDKYGGKFLTGEWLEVFFWYLLRQHATSLGVDSVRLGVEATKVGTDAGTDFDVSFMRNQSLCAIECKSGSQEQTDDVNVPLDKLEARIQQFRALRVRSWLATTNRKVLDASGMNVKPTLQARASIYGCQLITVPQIEQLARNADSAETVQSVLFRN